MYKSALERYGPDGLTKLMETETWREIPGYEGFYEASSWGRIRSLDRLVNKGGGRNRIAKGRVLRLNQRPDGYLNACLCQNSILNSFTTHSLTMKTFVGPTPAGLECLHFDDIKSNNRLDNLRYDSRSENRNDARRNGNLTRGSSIGSAKLSDEIVELIWYNKAKETQQALADRYGVTHSNVSAIQRGKSWGWLTSTLPQ